MSAQIGFFLNFQSQGNGLDFVFDWVFVRSEMNRRPKKQWNERKDKSSVMYP